MEKVSVQTFVEYNEERFTKKVIFNTGETTAFVLNFLPGQQLPTHKHPGAEVYLSVVTGHGTFIVDGNETQVSEDDVIHVSDQEEMSFRNTGSEPVSLYVVLSNVSR